MTTQNQSAKTPTIEDFKRWESRPAWETAQELGLGYSGDYSPIPHGGYFYSETNWERYDYAACVEFWFDEDNKRFVVQTGTIHKGDLSAAVNCSGQDIVEVCQSIPMQIEVCKEFSGIEPDEAEFLHSYDLETWKEWRIWKSVWPMLKDLQNL